MKIFLLLQLRQTAVMCGEPYHRKIHNYMTQLQQSSHSEVSAAPNVVEHFKIKCLI